MPIRRPPGLSICTSRSGTMATEPDSAITSKGPSADRSAVAPSATRTSTFSTPARCRLARAKAARPLSISSDSTRWARWPSSAAMKPEPVPISSTFSCLATCRSCRMRASMRGSSMTWPAAMPASLSDSGICMSAKARARKAGGTKSSRLTTASNSSTWASSTSHGRICCSIMLKRACSTFMVWPPGVGGSCGKTLHFIGWMGETGGVWPRRQRRCAQAARSSR